MKRIQSVLLIAFTAVLFIGNTVGIDVFKHICNTEGFVSYSYIISDDSHCQDELTAGTESKSCCHEEKEPVNQKDDCCDDEQEHFQIDFVHFSEFTSHAFHQITGVNHGFGLDYFLEIAQPRELLIPFQPNPPPTILSKHRMILNQVFIV